jgi:cytoskeletal protein RodZ
MTALLAPRPSRDSHNGPRLKALTKPNQQVATVPFVLIVAAVLALGMVGMLVLSTTLQNQSFEIEKKQHSATALADQVSQLKSELAQERSVRNLAAKAHQLGMRPDPYSVPMRLSDGKVMGKARPVAGSELPSVRSLTAEQAAAQAAKKAAAAAAHAQAQAQAVPANGTGQ